MEPLKPSSEVRGVAKVSPSAICDGRTPSPQQHLCHFGPPAAWLQSCPCREQDWDLGMCGGSGGDTPNCQTSSPIPVWRTGCPALAETQATLPCAGRSTGCAGQSRSKAGMSSGWDAGSKLPAEHPQTKQCPEMDVSPHVPASSSGIGSQAHSCAGAALVFLCKLEEKPPMVLTFPPVC